MLTTSEQHELRQIEQELRHADRGLAWRLTLLQGMLRWAAPGRRGYLPALAAVMTALLWVLALPGRLLIAAVRGAAPRQPTALVAFGDMTWPVTDPWQRDG